MSSPPPVVLPPEPWYRSEVQVRAVVAIIAQLASVILRAIGRYTEVNISAEQIDLIVADVLQVVAIVFGLMAILKRKDSAIQPLTLTEAEAVKRRQETTSILPSDPTRQAGLVRPLMLAVLLGLAAPAVLVLHGCQSVGVAQPQSFEQRYAYASGIQTAIQNAATAANEARTISLEDAKYILRVAEESDVALRTARTLAQSGDVASAEGRLLLITNILTELQRYLSQKGIQS